MGAPVGPGAPSSLLVPDESPGHVQLEPLPVNGPPPDLPLPTDFRHSGWERRRQATRETLRSTGVADSRVRRFDRCGSGFWILQRADDKTRFKLCVDYCRDRWCVPCQRARASRIVVNLAEHFDDRPYRLITLTLRHHAEPLTDTLDRLYESFKRLRRQKRWKNSVVGGCAFVEVVLGKADGLWHAHLHIICEGTWYGHGDLSKDWQLATGDSFIVDIRLVRKRDDLARYVLKYTVKPSNVDPLSQSSYMLELMQALGSRRTIIPFGTWVHLRLLSVESDEGWIRYSHSSDLGWSDKRDKDLDAVLQYMVDCAWKDPTIREFNIGSEPRPPPAPSKHLTKHEANEKSTAVFPALLAVCTLTHYATF